MTSFTLSLQHTASKTSQSDTLPDLIKRIHQQRGHFRNVSESGLLEEIAAAESDEDEHETEQNDTQDLSDDLSVRREEIYMSKESLRKYIAQAQNDALTSLDFVSLLLSKDKPLQGGMSMSPALKQMVPAGSLAFEKFQASNTDKNDEQRQERLVLGWNFESLSSTADKLLQSAIRLEKEIEKETNYWNQVLTVSNKGWSLCRMPGERHTIGVRFGFAEAAAAFQNRDLAALKPDIFGDIVLDQGLANQPKAVAVRIKQGNSILSTSKLPSIADNEEYDIETYIHRARDSLFEEELFFEMTKEARNLLPYGIKTINDTIQIPVPSKASQEARAIQIELVSLEDDQKALAERQESDDIVESVAIALRILLTHAYHMKFRCRTQPPPPLTTEKQLTPALPILRPLMNHFQHHRAVRELSALLYGIRSTPSPPTAISTISKLSARADSPMSTTLMESLVSALSRPLSTTVSVPISVQLAKTASHADGAKAVIAVTATTSLFEPLYGTQFTASLSEFSVPLALTKAAKLRSNVPFVGLLELREYLEEFVDARQRGEQATSDHGVDQRRNLGPDDSAREQKTADSSLDGGLGGEIEVKESLTEINTSRASGEGGVDVGGSSDMDTG